MRIDLDKILSYFSLVFIFPGNKKSWTRMSKGRSRSGHTSLSGSQSELIMKACVMYQTVLSTFSQIKLDILTGLWFKHAKTKVNSSGQSKWTEIMRMHWLKLEAKMKTLDGWTGCNRKNRSKNMAHHRKQVVTNLICLVPFRDHKRPCFQNERC